MACSIPLIPIPTVTELLENCVDFINFIGWISRPHQSSPDENQYPRRSFARIVMVEPRGFEPLTSCMPCKRSPS